MPAIFNPRSAIVYFDLCFEECDHEEDVRLAEMGSADAAERLAEVLNRSPGDFGHALHLHESGAMGEMAALIGSVFPGRKVDNEGHDFLGNLVMKVGVNTLEEATALAALVAQNTGGGEDCIYLNTRYFCAQGFRLYSNGVNSASIPLHELAEALEEGRVVAPVAA